MVLGVSQRLPITEARNEAEKANRAKSAFLATASHDLRQPLQTLMLLTSVLEKTSTDPRALTAERRTPDLIVSDFHLGGEDTGVQAIGEIRKLAGWSIPAVLVTGDTSKHMVDAVELSGNCEVLSKPVAPLEFLERVNTLLQKPKASSASHQ